MAETNQYVFGLDIGTRSIVGTVGYKKGNKFIVVAQCNKEHETRAMLDGQIHDIGKVAETIKDVKKRLEDQINVKLTYACIAAAGRVLKTMQIHSEIDLEEERTVTEEDIYTLHSYAIEDAYKKFLDENNTDLKFYCVGSSVVRYYLNDFAMSNLENHKAKRIGVDLIATFLPDDVVDGLYRAVELAGLEVGNMTLEPIAAIQLAIPERFRLLNIALVDVGAGTSDISITKDGTIIAFGMIPTAGDALTETIAMHCMVDFNTAEIIKRKGDTDDVIEYEDIMGTKLTITKEELAEVVKGNVDEMATLAADKIKELNGGKSVGAVFVVGGGGVIPGYTSALAEKLSLAPERVALRGKEVMNDIVFEKTELDINSLLVTPIGICLNFYEESNNFLFVNFNGTKVKLYNNSNLTVMDAAMQTDFPSNGFFPKSGKELNFIVNGKNRMVRGEMGEPAEIKVNGNIANLHTPIKENDIIEVKESTAGDAAKATIASLPEYKSVIKVNVNNKLVELPKFASVNGTLQSEYYEIASGDDIEILDYYTVDQIVKFMDVEVDDTFDILVNNSKATGESKVYENFSVSWEKADRSYGTYADLPEDDMPKTEYAAPAPQFASQPVEMPQSAPHIETQTLYNVAAPVAPQQPVYTAPQPAYTAPQPAYTAPQPVYTAPQPTYAAPQPAVATQTPPEQPQVVVPTIPIDLHIVVNGRPVTLKGKPQYVFVDIFDFYEFDLSHSQGTLVTNLNGRKAGYMEVLKEGDFVELNWKK